MNPTSEPCCRNCHFFTKISTLEPELGAYALSRDERTSLKISCSGMLNPSFCCAQGVWSYALGSEEGFGDFVDRPRADSCFFTPERPGMSVDAAKMLYDREAANRELRKSYRYTQIGLWIAAAALVVSALSNLVGLLME